MIVKDGDIVDFVGISWNEKEWDFDHPTVLLSPVVRYSPNGDSVESLIEDVACELSWEDDVEDEDVEDEFEWRGWKLSNLRRVVRERGLGKDTWKTKIRDIMTVKVLFYEEDGELQFRYIS